MRQLMHEVEKEDMRLKRHEEHEVNDARGIREDMRQQKRRIHEANDPRDIRRKT